MAAATETFMESITPLMGILMAAVAELVHWEVSPVASVPTAIAEGRV